MSPVPVSCAERLRRITHLDARTELEHFCTDLAEVWTARCDALKKLLAVQWAGAASALRSRLGQAEHIGLNSSGESGTLG